LRRGRGRRLSHTYGALKNRLVGDVLFVRNSEEITGFRLKLER